MKKQSTPIIIDSGLPGPTVTILGGIHGDEACGVQAIDIIRDTLRLRKGKVFLIYGNLDAIDKNTRQIDLNLNRMFRDDETFSLSEINSVEYRRSREIMPYLDLSDASLDLHSSPTLGSPAFIICEENCQEVIQEFPFETVCYGFTEMEPGGTDGYMNSRGKIGICVECGQHNDPTANDRALVSIRNFLEYFDMLDDGISDRQIPAYTEKQFFKAKYAYKTKTIDFRVVKPFSDFENIQEGQAIAMDGDTIVKAKNTGKILFARDRHQIGVEGFVEIISL